MITPYDDKLSIKAILDTDPYIQRANFKPQNIETTKFGTDVLNNKDSDFMIFIYNGTTESTYGTNQKGVVYNVTVVGKREYANRVDNVSQQIMALLNECNIGRNHILYLLDTPIELESDRALYITEMSFIAFESIYNKIKK